jgi:hypothetical protein
MLTIPVARRQFGMLVTIYNDGNNNATYQLTYGHSSTDLLDNANWVKTGLGIRSSTEWIDSVTSILLIEPELTSPGTRYLLGISPDVYPSGTNWDNYTPTTIVEYNTLGSWGLIQPSNGMTVRVDDDNSSVYKYEGDIPDGDWK